MLLTSPMTILSASQFTIFRGRSGVPGGHRFGRGSRHRTVGRGHPAGPEHLVSLAGSAQPPCTARGEFVLSWFFELSLQLLQVVDGNSKQFRQLVRLNRAILQLTGPQPAQ